MKILLNTMQQELPWPSCDLTIIRSAALLTHGKSGKTDQLKQPRVSESAQQITTCDISRDCSRCISARSSQMRRATGSSLTTGLFTMFFARCAYSNVLIVSV